VDFIVGTVLGHCGGFSPAHPFTILKGMVITVVCDTVGGCSSVVRSTGVVGGVGLGGLLSTAPQGTFGFVFKRVICDDECSDKNDKKQHGIVHCLSLFVRFDLFQRSVCFSPFTTPHTFPPFTPHTFPPFTSHARAPTHLY
jgi:hypothetical protein